MSGPSEISDRSIRLENVTADSLLNKICLISGAKLRFKMSRIEDPKWAAFPWSSRVD